MNWWWILAFVMGIMILSGNSSNCRKLWVFRNLTPAERELAELHRQRYLLSLQYAKYGMAGHRSAWEETNKRLGEVDANIHRLCDDLTQG